MKWPGDTSERAVRRAAAARARLVATSLSGLGVYFALPALPLVLRALIAWDAAALVFVALTLWLALAADANETRHLATRADSTRAGARLLLLAASSVSLIGVGRGLSLASKLGGAPEVALIVAGLLAVALSWGTLHVMYMLHYAHLYYAGERGGVDFNQQGDPNYRDFLYLALTVGMTYQVSDTQLTSPALRFEVIKHALLSFVFGTVIVAFSINVTAGLLK